MRIDGTEDKRLLARLAYIRYSMLKNLIFFAEKTPPTGLIEYLYMFYVYDGDCNSNAAQEQAKTNFDTNLGICGTDCKKEDIKVYCGAASTVARRKRRSVKQLSVRMTIRITRSKADALKVRCLSLKSVCVLLHGAFDLEAHRSDDEPKSR